MIVLCLSARQAVTIQVALRFWQENLKHDHDGLLGRFGTYFESGESALSGAQLDRLCARIADALEVS